MEILRDVEKMEAPPVVNVMALVGLSLSTWSQVERSLTHAFAVVSGMEARKAIAMFDSVISLEIRLAMLDRLMQFETHDEVEAEMWERLSVRITKSYKKRHELAHFTIATNLKGEWGVSPFLTFDKMFDPARTVLTQEVIRERHQRFFLVSEAIDWFKDRALVRRGQPPEGPLRESAEPQLVPQLRELAARTLEERKLRPRPTKPEDYW